MIIESSQYEAGLLGALISYPDARRVIPHLRQDDFGTQDLKDVFAAVDTLSKINAPIDDRTVTQWLRQYRNRSMASQVTELACAACVPSSVDYYLREMQSDKLRRAFYQAADRLDSGTDPVALARNIEAILVEPKEEAKEAKYFTFGDVAAKLLEEIEEHQLQGGTIKGVPSGIADLDEHLLGFQNGELTVLGGRPSIGKTAIGLNIAANVATVYDMPVFFVCLEMSRFALARRFLSAKTGAATKAMRRGTLGIAALEDIRLETSKTKDVPIILADQTCGIRTPADIAKRFFEMDPKPRLVIVDHLGLLDSGTGATKSYEVTSEVSFQLKRLAVDLDVPVIALCQLKRPDIPRAVKKKPTERQFRPDLTDLRNSGTIEQDADQVLFIHRPAYYNDFVEEHHSMSEAYLLVRKNREGELVEIGLKYEPAQTLFTSWNQNNKVDLFDPNKAPQLVEEPQAVNEKPIEYERVDDVFTDLATGFKYRIWADDKCEQKVRDAIAHDGAVKIWDDCNEFVNKQTTITGAVWAAACYEKLSETYDRLTAQPAAVPADDWSIFGL